MQFKSGSKYPLTCQGRTHRRFAFQAILLTSHYGYAMIIDLRKVKEHAYTIPSNNKYV